MTQNSVFILLFVHNCITICSSLYIVKFEKARSFLGKLVITHAQAHLNARRDAKNCPSKEQKMAFLTLTARVFYLTDFIKK